MIIIILCNVIKPANTKNFTFLHDFYIKGCCTTYEYDMKFLLKLCVKKKKSQMGKTNKRRIQRYVLVTLSKEWCG